MSESLPPKPRAWRALVFHVRALTSDCPDAAGSRMPEVPNYGIRRLLSSMSELRSGVCPVCGVNWGRDPDRDCACTRPRAGDAAAMADAYYMATRCREAQLARRAAEHQAELDRRARVAARQPGTDSRAPAGQRHLQAVPARTASQ